MGWDDAISGTYDSANICIIKNKEEGENDERGIPYWKKASNCII